MKCDEVRSHVWDYLDGEASPAVAAEVEAHLASCAACKELFEEYGRFKEAFAPLPQEELPFDFEEKIQTRFAEEKRTMKKPLYRRGWVKGLAACCCLILALGVFTLGANLFTGKGGFDVAASEAATAPMAAPTDEMQYTAAMDSGYVVMDTAATEIADEDFAPEEPKEMTETTGEALPVGDGVAEEGAGHAAGFSVFPHPGGVTAGESGGRAQIGVGPGIHRMIHDLQVFQHPLIEKLFRRSYLFCLIG